MLEVASLEAALGAWGCGGSHCDGRQAPARQRHSCGARGAPAGGVQRRLGRGGRPVAGRARQQRDHRTALGLLRALPLAGSVVTGDTIFAQEEICRVIRDGGGDYFLRSRTTSPRLKPTSHWRLAALLPPQPQGRRLTSPAPKRSARGMAASKRARCRRRPAWRPTSGLLGPAWRRCAASRAAAWCAAKKASKPCMAITSLPPGKASAADLLALSRNH